jgi:hypothetical protein
VTSWWVWRGPVQARGDTQVGVQVPADRRGAGGPFDTIWRTVCPAPAQIGKDDTFRSPEEPGGDHPSVRSRKPSVRYSLPTDSADPDEDMWQPKSGCATWYYYRRGLTRSRRAQLDEAERRGDDLDHEAVNENAWDYAIVYRETTTSECILYRCRRGTTIMRILSMRELLGVLRRRYPDVLNNY